jgi:hypothetical protein
MREERALFHSDCPRLPGLDEDQSMEGIPARQITYEVGWRGRNYAETKHLRPFGLPYGER